MPALTEDSDFSDDSDSKCEENHHHFLNKVNQIMESNKTAKMTQHVDVLASEVNASPLQAYSDALSRTEFLCCKMSFPRS